MSYITRAQPQPRQQQQDCAVAQTPWSRAITRSNDAGQLAFRQAVRQPGQPPTCDGRNGEGKIVAGFARKVEIAQERS